VGGFLQTEHHITERLIREWLQRPVRPSAAAEILEVPAVIATTIGDVRTENQDRAIVARFSSDRRSSFLLAALCDGLGGMQDGGKCADIGILALLMRMLDCEAASPDERLRFAVESANKAIYQRYHGDGGTTITAVLLSHYGVAAASVGDSRIYSYSKSKRLRQISVDDTIAGELGRLKNTEPSNLDLEPFSHRLAQFVGVGDDMETRLYKLSDIGPDSTLILSSDGAHLTGPAIFQAIIETATTPYTAVSRLLQLSRWCGGKDNATLVSFRGDIRERLQIQENALYSRLELWDSSGKLDVVLEKGVPHPAAPIPPTQPEERSQVSPELRERPRTRAGAKGKTKKAGTGEKAPPLRPAQRTLEIELVKGSVGEVLPPAIDLSGPDASALNHEVPQATNSAESSPSPTSAKGDPLTAVPTAEASKHDSSADSSGAKEGVRETESQDRQTEKKEAGRGD